MVNKTGDELLFSPSLSKLWKGVSSEIGNSQSHNIFRTSIYQYLLKKSKGDGAHHMLWT